MPDENVVYREAARLMYGRDGLRIPEHGFVQRMAEGGAFVEAVVWVPETATVAVRNPDEVKP